MARRKNIYNQDPYTHKKRTYQLVTTIAFIVIAVICVAVLPNLRKTSSSSSSSSSVASSSSSASSTSVVVTNSTLGSTMIEPVTATTCASLTTTFVEMVKQYGDAIYIKCGNFDMLIDAGQSEDGANVRKVLTDNITDNTIEFLVVTHAHSDHMGGLLEAVGDYKVNYILDFGHRRTTYSLYRQYETARNGWVSNGAKYCSAKDAVSNRNNCSSTIYLTSDIHINMIDTGYYAENGVDVSSSYDFNRSSVTFILYHNNTSYYYSGDLTDEGEAKIYKKVPNVDLMKATHHGTAGGNTTSLVNALAPKYVIISASADPSGESKADQHPYQEALNSFYNSANIYKSKNVYFNMTMGTIKILDEGNGITSVTGSDTLLGGYKINGVSITGENGLKLHETAWFKAYRVLPS